MVDQNVKEYLEESLTRGFVKHINLELTELEPGHARMDIILKEHHENIYHRIHGGVLFSIADTTSGFAARSNGIHVVTSDCSFNYLRAAHEDAKSIYCVADTIKMGKTLVVMDANVYDDHNNLLCRGSFTYCVINLKK